MTDKIEPALSTEEWAACTSGSEPMSQVFIFEEERGEASPRGPYISRELVFEAGDSCCARARPTPIRDPIATIALCNYFLPDSDKRKITRENLELLRSIAAPCTCADLSDGCPSCDPATFRSAASFIDALESYLPPETT